jgi:hypothetical protein
VKTQFFRLLSRLEESLQSEFYQIKQPKTFNFVSKITITVKVKAFERPSQRPWNSCAFKQTQLHRLRSQNCCFGNSAKIFGTSEMSRESNNRTEEMDWQCVTLLQFLLSESRILFEVRSNPLKVV